MASSLAMADSSKAMGSSRAPITPLRATGSRTSTTAAAEVAEGVAEVSVAVSTPVSLSQHPFLCKDFDSVLRLLSYKLLFWFLAGILLLSTLYSVEILNFFYIPLCSLSFKVCFSPS